MRITVVRTVGSKDASTWSGTTDLGQLSLFR